MKREKQIIKEAERLIDPYEMFIDWEYERGLKEGFLKGANWADEHPNTDDIETVLAYTYKGLCWLAENVEFDMGTMGERALACTETLQLICNQTIMELRNKEQR